MSVMQQTAAEALRDHFLGWQCRIRQIAMRQDGGRPSPGMRPRVWGSDGWLLSPGLTVLIVPKEPAESTAFFRFQVQKNPDPRLVYEQGLALLQAEYFQQPKTFRDRLTALLHENSPIAAALIADGACVLAFEQFRQSYRLPCSVAELAPDDPAREATVWHNRLFNPSLPETVRVLAFQPDWGMAEAEPRP
jgi:hypothetical protein